MQSGNETNASSLLYRQNSNLPYGTSTYSRSDVAFGQDFPLYTALGEGWRCIDVDGNSYVDLIMGLGSVILGHRNSEVDSAIRRALANGTSMSLGNKPELFAADRVLRHFPQDCMLQWATNGTDATSGAIRLARAVTGRDWILMAEGGYHGFADWSLAGTSRGLGIPTAGSRICRFKLEQLDDPDARIQGSGTAAIIIEPDLHPDWLRPIRAWCDKHRALMIADEVMTWQRYPEWTGCAHFDVTPDLWCLGKSLGNGMPVSAIIGSTDIMRRFATGPLPNAFFSSTWAGHPLSMAAVIATIEVMHRESGPKQLWEKARTLRQFLEPLDKHHQITLGQLPFNRVEFRSIAQRRHFQKHMASNGVLIYAAHNLSMAHDENAIAKLQRAWETYIPLETDPDMHTENEIMRR